MIDDGLSDGAAAVAEQEAAQKAAKRSAHDTAVVMSTREGRRFVYEILSGLGVFVPVYTARQAGAQEGGMILIADRVKRAGHDFYHVMLRENERDDDVSE